MRTRGRLCFWFLLAGWLAPAPARSLPAEGSSSSLVKLRVAYQEYDSDSPWKKKNEDTRTGYGCVISPGRILTTADLVRANTLIKVEKGSSGESFTGRVEIADYEIDLAVVAVEEAFFTDLTGVIMEETVSIDQPVKFLVFEESKEVREIPGNIVRITLDDYFFSWLKYLTYGASVSFENRGGGWSEPVFAGEKLVGITMSYDGERQYAKIIPASIIRRFLAGIRPDGYRGFAHPGFEWSDIISPDFRKYLGLLPSAEGVYISRVLGKEGESPWRTGDILLSLDGRRIDSEGYYRHPGWGKMACPDLVQRCHSPGETVALSVFREGRAQAREMKLARFDPEEFLVPHLPVDRPPRYLVVGGLIIQELTRDYLKTWGKEWEDRANKKLLNFYLRRADEPEPGRERIVILNKVLPDEINVGYQDLDNLVLARVNGRPIGRIQDVAAALRSPEGAFHRFTFEEHNQRVILPVETLSEADGRIGRQYGIDRLSRIDD